MEWSPIHNYTHYSLLKGFSKPEQLAKKCSENGYKACGIADYKSISGAVSFYQACKKHNIKPIIGCSFDNYTLIAKNKDGWLNLIEIVSLLDEDGNIPSELSYKVFQEGNLICIADKYYPILGKDSYVTSPALSPTYYCDKGDAPLHRVLLCSHLKTTLPKAKKSLKSGDFDPAFEKFFGHETFHLPDRREVTEILLDECSDEQINSVIEIVEKCEEYDILSKPMLPEFPIPTGETEEDLLKSLCREGWKRDLLDSGKLDSEESEAHYAERFREELGVIKDANLFGYFLIVWDIIRFVNSEGWLSGPGRGSAAGCLISYLMGITKIDPIEYDLLFERFYNSGRNTEGHISLPDIDIDVPGKKRDEIIDYLKDKYGHENVSQMITFGRLQGRSALKEVLRINEACSFGEMNEITKSLPNEADISDQLQEMDEEDRSIIRWALINNPEELRDFCFINDNGDLDGDYAEFFDQAIRMEGTFKSQGKHPAGVVISRDKLKLVCPMVKQRNKDEKLAGLEMSDLESLGHVKFDVLGINLLDKIMKVKDLINQT
jgi:DNA polymerase-3 subunit alpha|tara:strand:- start:760 stop:2403 length:1644 start_codon:yes stop_codon:yes gene_type:complete